MTHEVLVENTTRHYTQQITTGNHRFLADEPKDLKGDDLGPTPNELLLSALGSCTAITLTMYAELKNIQLDIISVRLKHIPENKADKTPTRIIRNIHLEGNFSEAQHQRMLEIADRCPVHRALKQGIEIDSTLV